MITNDDKINVVNQHLKNVDLNTYNLELSVIEENAKSTPSQIQLNSLQTQLTDLAAQKTLLEAELASLQGE